MAGCKCRFCQARLLTQNAYKTEIGKKQIAYFCNEEHYNDFLAKTEESERTKQEEIAAKKLLAAKAKEEKEAKERARIEKSKADKNRVYYLICDIMERKAIINKALYKEWELWKQVAPNEVIGQYLEEHKEYLRSAVSNIENKEFLRIRYLSAILRNALGDYKPNTKETQKPKVSVDETIYQSSSVRNNKRRSLADLEDEF